MEIKLIGTEVEIATLAGKIQEKEHLYFCLEEQENNFVQNTKPTVSNNTKRIFDLAKTQLSDEDQEYAKDIILVLMDVYIEILHCESSELSENERKKLLHCLFSDDTFEEVYQVAHARTILDPRIDCAVMRKKFI